MLFPLRLSLSQLLSHSFQSLARFDAPLLLCFQCVLHLFDRCPVAKLLQTRPIFGLELVDLLREGIPECFELTSLGLLCFPTLDERLSLDARLELFLLEYELPLLLLDYDEGRHFAQLRRILLGELAVPLQLDKLAQPFFHLIIARLIG